MLGAKRIDCPHGGVVQCLQHSIRIPAGFNLVDIARPRHKGGFGDGVLNALRSCGRRYTRATRIPNEPCAKT